MIKSERCIHQDYLPAFAEVLIVQNNSMVLPETILGGFEIKIGYSQIH